MDSVLISSSLYCTSLFENHFMKSLGIGKELNLGDAYLIVNV